MCGQTVSKYPWLLYLRSLYSLTTITPLETAGLSKILHIFGAYIGTLQMLPLILINSPFPCIIAIILNKIPLEIGTFSYFFESFNSSGIESRAILLQTARHRSPFL